MFVIANVFPKLQTVNDLVKPLSRKRSFRKSFGSQHVKGSQILVKSAGEINHHMKSSYFLMNLRGNDLENISLIER